MKILLITILLSLSCALTKTFKAVDTIEWVSDLKVANGNGIFCSRVEAHVLEANKDWITDSPFCDNRDENGWCFSSNDQGGETIVASSSSSHMVFGKFKTVIEVGKTYKVKISASKLITDKSNESRLHLICVEPTLRENELTTKTLMKMKRAHLASSETFQVESINDDYKTSCNVAEIYDVSNFDMWDMNSQLNTCSLTNSRPTTRAVVDQCGNRYDIGSLYELYSKNYFSHASCSRKITHISVDERFTAQKIKLTDKRILEMLKDSDVLARLTCERQSSNLKTEVITEFHISTGYWLDLHLKGLDLLHERFGIVELSDDTFYDKKALQDRQKELENSIIPSKKFSVEHFAPIIILFILLLWIISSFGHIPISANAALLGTTSGLAFEWCSELNKPSASTEDKILFIKELLLLNKEFEKVRKAQRAYKTKISDVIVSEEPEEEEEEVQNKCSPPKLIDEDNIALKSRCLVDAIESNRLDLAEQLINNGANVNFEMGKPLSAAINNRNANAVRLLLRANVGFHSGNVNLAIKLHEFEIVKLFIIYGARVHTNLGILMAALDARDKKIVELLLDNNAPYRKLPKKYKGSIWRQTMGIRYWEYRVRRFFRKMFLKRKKNPVEFSENIVDLHKI